MKDAQKGPSTAKLFENKQLSQEDLWSRCALSGSPLDDPVVSDYKGRLYRKEAILEWLLDKPETLRPLAGHITGLKDIVTLIRSKDNQGRWICEITSKDVIKESAKKFVYLAECGHVFSESALKEVSGGSKSDHRCFLCDREYDPSNVIILNPEAADIERLEKRYKELKKKGLRHSLKPLKTKKRVSAIQTSGSHTCDPCRTKKVRVDT